MKFLDIFYYEKSNDIHTDNELIPSFDTLNFTHDNDAWIFEEEPQVQEEQQIEEEQQFEEEQPVEEELIVHSPIRRSTRSTSGVPP